MDSLANEFVLLFFLIILCALKGAPAGVAGHLSHNLTVDLIPQGFMLGGWTKDLLSQLYGTASMFDGVVAHVLQDRWRLKLGSYAAYLVNNILHLHATEYNNQGI